MVPVVITPMVEAASDIDATHRRRPLEQVGIFLALCTAILNSLRSTASLPGTTANRQFWSSLNIPVFSCQGSGFVNGGRWNFVGIDIRIGQMSFGQAKAADLAFNWAAGRGL